VFSAVVFAYSEVGHRCLNVLLDGGVQVPLVFTHEDQPGEQRWFGSVADLAAARGVRAVAPAQPATAEWLDEIRRLAPDYLLAFYYRSMLPPALLASARWGALNMHGSLLPHYRGGRRSTGPSPMAKPRPGPRSITWWPARMPAPSWPRSPWPST
jgi:methionyl-tRNA formyltransferase